MTFAAAVLECPSSIFGDVSHLASLLCPSRRHHWIHLVTGVEPVPERYREALNLTDAYPDTAPKTFCKTRKGERPDYSWLIYLSLASKTHQNRSPHDSCLWRDGIAELLMSRWSCRYGICSPGNSDSVQSARSMLGLLSKNKSLAESMTYQTRTPYDRTVRFQSRNSRPRRNQSSSPGNPAKPLMRSACFRVSVPSWANATGTLSKFVSSLESDVFYLLHLLQGDLFLVEKSHPPEDIRLMWHDHRVLCSNRN